MAVNIATLAIKFVADTSGIKQGVSSVVGSVLAGAAAFLTINRAISTFTAGAERIDKMSKVADRLGVSFKTIQAAALTGKLAGVDLESMTTAIDHMSKTIGSGGKSLDKRFLEQAEAIAAIKDPALQAAKAQEVFGRGMTKLLPLLKGGRNAFREAADLIERFDLGISDLEAANVERMNDSWTKLTAVLQGAVDKIVVQAAPAMSAFLDHTIDQLADLGTSWDDVGHVITAVLGEVAVIMDGIRGVFFETRGIIQEIQGAWEIKGGLMGLSNHIEAKKAYDRFLNGTAAKEIAEEAAKRRFDAAGKGPLGKFGGIETKFAPSAERGSAAAAKIINAAGGSMATEAEKDAAATAANTKAMREGIDRIAKRFSGDLPVLAVGSI